MPLQPRPDTARTTRGLTHRPPVPAEGKGGTPTQLERGTPTLITTESTAQPTITPQPPGPDPATFDCKGHRTDARAQTPEGEGDTAATPRTGDDTRAEGQDGRGPNETQGTTPPHPTEPGTPLGTGTPRGHGTKSQARREGNPADIRLTNQTERHTETPATLTEAAAARQTTHTDHEPTT